MNRDRRFEDQALALGHRFDGEIKVGGKYAAVVRDGNHLYVSGQIPRVGDAVVVTGAVGRETSLADAQHAAKICVMRALALLQRSLGSLERVIAIPRVTVYVQSAPGFTLQSEVADAASGLLVEVLGDVGVHARTSVGVFQLPKDAAVEIDLLATVESAT